MGQLKWLFAVNGIIGVLFLVGNALGAFFVDILVSFIWGALFPITALLLAKKFRNGSN
jgi:drug/metabolite transporter (DMT)-like permease